MKQCLNISIANERRRLSSPTFRWSRRQSSRKYDPRKAGMALVEFALMLILLAGTLNFTIDFLKEAAERRQARVAAGQLEFFTSAAEEYIQNNYAVLQATATATTAAVVNGATIQTAGHLPASWTTSNVWGQNYLLYVVEPSAGDLLGLVVTTGGRDATGDPEFGSVTVPYAAFNAGSRAGHVPVGTITGEVSTTLRGTGDWTYDTTPITNYTDPGAGHLAAQIAFFDGALAEDFLYRVGVPGRPELNQMQTNMDMNGNSITTVGSLQLQSQPVASMACGLADSGNVYFNDAEGLFICRNGSLESYNDSGNAALFKNAHVATHGELVPKVTCPTGTGTNPEVFVAPSIVSEDDSSPAMSSVQSWAVDAGADWLIQLRVLTSNGWTNPTSDYGRVMVFQTCN